MYGLSPVWIRTCIFKLPLCENFAPHISHMYGLSPVWIRTCIFKLPLCENCAPQVSHLYGLSPVWIRIWTFNWLLCENCAPHVSHLYGLSPVWIRIWFFKRPLCENCAQQVSHLYGLSPVWTRICVLKQPLCENCAPQVSHLKRFSVVRVFTFTAILKTPAANLFTFTTLTDFYHNLTHTQAPLRITLCHNWEISSLYMTVLYSARRANHRRRIWSFSPMFVSKGRLQDITFCKTFPQASYTQFNWTLRRMSCRCINAFQFSQNMLVTPDWFPSLNELVFSYKNIFFHKWQSQMFSSSRSQKRCGRSIMWIYVLHFWEAQGVTLDTINVGGFLQLCYFIADTSDANTFRQLSHLPETTTEVSESTTYVSIWDNTVIIV